MVLYSSGKELTVSETRRVRFFSMAEKNRKLFFKKQAKVAQAVAHPIRIEILNFLKDNEQCVRDIAKNVKSERSNVSRHLAVMVNAGVIESRQKGPRVIYNLKIPCILDFFTCVTQVMKLQAKENEEILKVI